MLVTRVDSTIEDQSVSTSTTFNGVVGQCNRESDRVVVSTEVNRAVGKRTGKHHAVGAGTAVNTRCCNRAGEQQQIRSASPNTTALLLTPAEKFRVSFTSTAKNRVAGQHRPKAHRVVTCTTNKTWNWSASRLC